MMYKHGLQPKFSIINAMTAALTRIERARGFLEAAMLSEDWVYHGGASVVAGGTTPRISKVHA